MNTTSEKVHTPRLRTDLLVNAVDEGGISYFDVKDPRTGHALRLYHFEWLVAQRLDGERTFDEISSWAMVQFNKLGWGASSEDLRLYAERLRELGLIEVSVAEVAAKAIAARPLGPVAVVDEMPVIEDADRPGAGPVPPLVLGDGPLAGGGGEMGESGGLFEPADAKPSALAEPTVKMAAPSDVGKEVTWGMAAPPKSSRSITVVLIALLIFSVGFALYWYLLAPRFSTLPVTVQAAPLPSTVVRYYEGEAKLGRSQPVVLEFGDAGRVLDVVQAGADIKPGMVLATLNTYPDLAKQLADVRDREVHYAEALRLAQAKGNPAEIKLAEQKVAEKRRLSAELGERVKKARLLAAHEGLVEEVMVKPGDEVKAKSEALRLVDRRLQADFRLTPAAAAAFKEGMGVAVRTGNGTVRVGAKVLSVEGAIVRIELEEDANGALKAGDSVRLERDVVSGIIRLPASAVSKSASGADQVFVVRDGTARVRKVTVVEHGLTDALVSGGIAPGEPVIVRATSELTDGRRIKSGP